VGEVKIDSSLGGLLWIVVRGRACVVGRIIFFLVIVYYSGCPGGNGGGLLVLSSSLYIFLWSTYSYVQGGLLSYPNIILMPSLYVD
jgi:hypothetical protein